jgi:hypothetical protein
MKPTTTLAAYLLCLTAAQAATPVTPTFFARRDYAGLLPAWIQVADTNGDGIPDLVAAGGPGFEVEFGNGNGTFSPGPSSSASGGVAQFFLLDLNGDGIVDAVYTATVGSKQGVAVSLGNGDGTFQPGTFYSTTDSVLRCLVIGDFNGDGIPDVAAAGFSGVWLFTGEAGGALSDGVLVSLLQTEDGPLAVADFNQDGNLDLVVGLDGGGLDASGAGFAVLMGNGNGTFQAPQTFAEPKKVTWLATGTLVTGGYPSIVASTGASSYVFVYIGNGAGGFTGPTYADLPGAHGVTGDTGFAIGDVNGDGIPDLVSTEGYIALGKGNGEFDKPYQYAINEAQDPYNVVLADLRRDGLTDILTSGRYAVSVLLSEGKGRYEDGVWTSVTGGSGCAAAADYNGDGKPDLAVITTTGVAVLLGTGEEKSPFTIGTPIAITGAACVVSGDLNGDGIPDLLVSVNGSPNALLAYLGNGNGTFTLAGTTPTPNSGGTVVLADFNDDGALDFATSGNLLGLGNGDGTFQIPTQIVASPPTGGYSGIATGDINNDGWPDLVLTSDLFPINANVTILLNNQKGGFTQVPASFGALTTEPILADLNGDGDLDLILATSSAAAVYIGNGTGSFTAGPVLIGAVDGNAYNVVADVNGDGIPDIIVLGSNTLGIFLGEAGTTYASPFYIGAGFSPSNILVESLHGQSASAGIPDIVAPDNTGGVLVLLNLTTAQ